MAISGSAVLSAAGYLSSNKPVLAVDFKISDLPSKKPKNVDRIVLTFDRIELTPQFVNNEKSFNLTATVDVDGKSRSSNASFKIDNGETKDVSNLVDPIEVGIDNDSSYLQGTVTIGVEHPQLTDDYSQSFNISDGFPTSDNSTGVYNVSTENYQQDLFFDMDNDGGDWILVSSNYEDDSTIPEGSSRKADEYEINRPGFEGPIVGDDGVSPSGDYIIGPIINEIEWSEVRVVGWDRSNTNSGNTYNDAVNRNVNNKVKAIWTVSSSKTNDKLTETVTDSNVSITTYNTSIYDSRIDVYYVDGIKSRKVISDSLNNNQTTIGGAGRSSNASSTWFGHGDSGTTEGWYNSSGNPSDSLGWATFVR